jgi:hypothetical protein
MTGDRSSFSFKPEEEKEGEESNDFISWDVEGRKEVRSWDLLKIVDG